MRLSACLSVAGLHPSLSDSLTRFCTLLIASAEVVLSDRSQAAVLAVQKEIADSSIHERAHVPPKAASVTEWNEIRDVFEWTDNKFGRIDVVLSSAGVTERPGFDDATYDGAALPASVQPPGKKQVLG